ncbi:MAG: hypothetical protein IKN96_08440 [Oscillibacter sp.]|nr:hypothetical protein [Oscillibacter sp.]
MGYVLLLLAGFLFWKFGAKGGVPIMLGCTVVALIGLVLIVLPPQDVNNLTVTVVALIGLVLIVPQKGKRKAPPSQPYVPPKGSRPPQPRKRIEDCVSREDVQYQLAYETQRIIQHIEASKEAIRQAAQESDRAVNTAWLNSYEKVLRISSNLDENLKSYQSRNLEYSKFQYYTSLHFRSMLAANIAHDEYQEINRSFETINQLIVSMAKNQKRSRLSKSQIYSAKDALKELNRSLLNKVHEMNHQTGILRDKIGAECGERGRKWYADRMRNRV